MCTLQGLHYTYLYSGKIIFDTIFANKRMEANIAEIHFQSWEANMYENANTCGCVYICVKTNINTKPESGLGK